MSLPGVLRTIAGRQISELLILAIGEERKRSVGFFERWIDGWVQEGGRDGRRTLDCSRRRVGCIRRRLVGRNIFGLVVFGIVEWDIRDKIAKSVMLFKLVSAVFESMRCS